MSTKIKSRSPTHDDPVIKLRQTVQNFHDLKYSDETNRDLRVFSLAYKNLHEKGISPKFEEILFLSWLHRKYLPELNKRPIVGSALAKETNPKIYEGWWDIAESFPFEAEILDFLSSQHFSGTTELEKIRNTKLPAYSRENNRRETHSSKSSLSKNTDEPLVKKEQKASISDKTSAKDQVDAKHIAKKIIQSLSKFSGYFQKKTK